VIRRAVFIIQYTSSEMYAHSNSPGPLYTLIISKTVRHRKSVFNKTLCFKLTMFAWMNILWATLKIQQKCS